MDFESRTVRMPWVVVILLLGLLGGGTSVATALRHAPPSDGPTAAQFDALRTTVESHAVAIGRLDAQLAAIQASLDHIQASLDRLTEPTLERRR